MRGVQRKGAALRMGHRTGPCHGLRVLRVEMCVKLDAGGAEEEGQDEYLLALESSDMANLCADVAALGFLGGSGVTPGRLLRVVHALTRVAVMTLSGTSPFLAAPR